MQSIVFSLLRQAYMSMINSWAALVTTLFSHTCCTHSCRQEERGGDTCHQRGFMGSGSGSEPS
uniref:Uncharacterized protein n=1 Tax=Anguilla anguilla TaxID=7936 RepID=A0A0E9RGS6_ANGAN